MPEAVLAPSGDDPLRKKAPDSTTEAESSLQSVVAALIRRGDGRLQTKQNGN